MEQIFEGTPERPSVRFVLGLRVRPNFSDRSWNTYMKKIPASIPDDIPVLKRVMRPISERAGKTIYEDEGIYLRDVPQLGILTMEGEQRLRKLKESKTQERERIIAYKLELLARQVELGFYEDDRTPAPFDDTAPWPPPHIDESLYALPEEEQARLIADPRAGFASYLVTEGRLNEGIMSTEESTPRIEEGILFIPKSQQNT